MTYSLELLVWGRRYSGGRLTSTHGTAASSARVVPVLLQGGRHIDVGYRVVIEEIEDAVDTGRRITVQDSTGH
jgi:hypothetical protein